MFHWCQLLSHVAAPLPPLVPHGMGKGSRGAPVPRSILYTLRSHCSAACGCVYTACAHVYDHAGSCGLPPRELQLVYAGAHAGTHTQLTGHCVAMAITSTAFTLGLLGFPPSLLHVSVDVLAVPNSDDRCRRCQCAWAKGSVVWWGRHGSTSWAPQLTLHPSLAVAGANVHGQWVLW